MVSSLSPLDYLFQHVRFVYARTTLDDIEVIGHDEEFIYFHKITKKTNRPFCVELKDNSLLCEILTEISQHPQMEASWIAEMLEKYPFGFEKEEELIEWYHRVKINTLRHQFYCLYMAYVCYKIFVWDEAVLTKEEMEIAEVSDDDDLSDVCYSFLLYVYTEKDFAVCSIFPHANGVCEETITCNSLFDALMYQLGLHLCAGKQGLNGETVAYCESCGKKYIQVTRKFQYCKNCRSDAARAARYRANKKKEAEHHAP